MSVCWRAYQNIRFLSAAADYLIQVAGHERLFILPAKKREKMRDWLCFSFFSRAFAFLRGQIRFGYITGNLGYLID
jgi:hypothetical protein